MDGLTPADRSKLLLRIARSVSDREPVEWESELEGAPDLLETLGRLRTLQTLASVHEHAAGMRLAAASDVAPPSGGAVPEATAAAAQERPGGLAKWGPLEILESLGRGGFGHVYRAYDPLLEREVALKLWRRGGGASRLLAEARALARVRHPNLPVVHGADEHGGWLGMWTDLVRGRTLEDLLAAHGPLGAREVALTGVEVCRALTAVHAAGLVHRDVKTSNVMREETGRVVLLDFGLAVEAAASATERGGGTPPSMAPELLRGEHATPSSDLYALGVLLYRLATGALPYDARTPAEVAGKQARGERVELHHRRPDLPDAFVRVVDRALGPTAGSRHSSAEAMERALHDFLGSAAMDAGGRDAPRPRAARPLPHFLTRFIGRDDELSQCHDAIRSHRLVTLVGPGGSGKTRLAIRATEAFAEAASAVAFADLSSLTEAATVEPEIRRALEISPAAGGDAPAPLSQTIGTSPLLLVLDNCEHLVATVGPLAADLLAACPRLTVVATSRSPLRVPGEQVLAVPPLSLPPSGVTASVASVAAFDAVRLFVERARLVRPDFRLTDQNAAAVADLCRGTDGLPLAIELAAARVRALTPEEIRDRLAEGPRLLGRGGFSTTARHESLETAIRWSYDSLPADERSLMDGLAVFTGTWTLQAAARVCLRVAPDLEVLDSITSLIEQSLVASAPACQGTSRYRLLETLRGFALDRLRESGRFSELEARHFDYFLGLAEQAEPQLWGPEQAAWSARLDADHPNLLAALEWAHGRADRAVDHLRLAGALARFWTERGYLTIGRQALASALEGRDPEADPSAYARGLLGAGTLAIYQSAHDQARSSCTRALALFRRLGSATEIARTLVTLGVVAHEVSDYAAAEECYRESLAIYRELADARGIAHVLNNLGAIAWRQDRWEEARRLHQEALAHAEPARDPGLRVLALTNLGFVSHLLGHTQEPAGCLAEALGLVREHRLLRHTAAALEAAAAVLARARESARAARLYAAAAQQRQDLGNRLESAWHKAHQPTLEAAARDLGPERLEAESQVGRALGFDEAIEEAWRGLELVV